MLGAERVPPDHRAAPRPHSRGKPGGQGFQVHRQTTAAGVAGSRRRAAELKTSRRRLGRSGPNRGTRPTSSFPPTLAQAGFPGPAAPPAAGPFHLFPLLSPPVPVRLRTATV